MSLKDAKIGGSFLAMETTITLFYKVLLLWGSKKLFSLFWVTVSQLVNNLDQPQLLCSSYMNYGTKDVAQEIHFQDRVQT